MQKNKKVKETKVVRFDWAIKNMLRQKSNFDILEGFLTALLNREIKVLSILESESNQDYEKNKFNRVDILVEEKDGSKIIVEVQNDREKHYLERLLYGTSKVITDNIDLGGKYSDVKKVISISILYFICGSNVDDYVYYGKTEFRGIHSNSLLKLKRKEAGVYKAIEIKDIYPEYYLIEVEKFQNIVESDLDEWIYFLKNEAIKDNFKSKNIKKAKKKLNYLMFSDGERRSYEAYMKNISIEKDVIDTKKEDIYEKGIEKGKIQIAINLLDVLDNQTISEKTGFSLEKIKKLRKEN